LASVKRLVGSFLSVAPVLAASQCEHSRLSDHGLTAEVVKTAKIAFPLTVLTVDKVNRHDGVTVYAIGLDARHIPRAPEAVITVFAAIAPDIGRDEVHRATREATADVTRLLQEHRQRLEGPIQVRSGLVEPAGE
jgi:hypothetical protein